MANRKRKKTNSKKHCFTNSQKTIICVIIAAMIAVVVALVCSFLLKPEDLVKSKISELSRDYYENHLYQNFISENSNISDEKLAETMSKYEEHGLASVILRQILLYDHQKNADVAPMIKEYCDEDHTTIKFYPEPPYTKTSYHIEYKYSCEF